MTTIGAARCTNPIFIVGTERSGSNLLRLLLNSHPVIAAPHPPHVVAYFAPLQRHYGALESKDNFEKFVDDILTHVKYHIHPWTSPIDIDALVAAASPRTALGVSSALYDQHAAYVGKPRWACKSTFMVDYIGEALAVYPAAQFIWLVRDPRDVALSSRNSVFNPFHPYYTARLWRDQQLAAFRWERRLPRETIFRLHYEDLVARAPDTLARLCSFLRVQYDPAMMEFFRSEDARISATIARDWRNNAKPIARHNSRKYLAGLSTAQARIIESLAGEVMSGLGYYSMPGRDGDARRVGLVRRALYFLQDVVLRVRVEILSLCVDRNWGRRWARSLRMTWLTARLRMGIR